MGSSQSSCLGSTEDEARPPGDFGLVSASAYTSPIIGSGATSAKAAKPDSGPSRRRQEYDRYMTSLAAADYAAKYYTSDESRGCHSVGDGGMIHRNSEARPGRVAGGSCGSTQRGGTSFSNAHTGAGSGSPPTKSWKNLTRSGISSGGSSVISSDSGPAPTSGSRGNGGRMPKGNNGKTFARKIRSKIPLGVASSASRSNHSDSGRNGGDRGVGQPMSTILNSDYFYGGGVSKSRGGRGGGHGSGCGGASSGGLLRGSSSWVMRGAGGTLEERRGGGKVRTKLVTRNNPIGSGMGGNLPAEGPPRGSTVSINASACGDGSPCTTSATAGLGGDQGDGSGRSPSSLVGVGRGGRHIYAVRVLEEEDDERDDNEPTISTGGARESAPTPSTKSKSLQHCATTDGEEIEIVDSTDQTGEIVLGASALGGGAPVSRGKAYGQDGTVQSGGSKRKTTSNESRRAVAARQPAMGTHRQSGERGSSDNPSTRTRRGGKNNFLPRFRFRSSRRRGSARCDSATEVHEITSSSIAGENSIATHPDQVRAMACGNQFSLSARGSSMATAALPHLGGASPIQGTPTKYGPTSDGLPVDYRTIHDRCTSHFLMSPRGRCSRGSDSGSHGHSHHRSGGASNRHHQHHIPRGCALYMFSPEAVNSSIVPPAEELICVDAENDIYVADIGLTSAQCDIIVETTERCSRGTYAAYTYAKQTLGCREYDELAIVCEWPVMTACATIREKLNTAVESVAEANGGEDGGVRSGNGDNGCKADRKLSRRKKELILDEREPHLVKYDVSKKERQKLDMHTDKSEWTFLIALSDGCGLDYDEGGTYFEAIDSTVHLQRGHVLIFPGKLRHRGEKITRGLRFLLVGFLVDQNGDDADKAKPTAAAATNSAAVNGSAKK